jgi:crotonobetainyl-CoA:carnitine CoA-transferase CaiB-like acyl-CoA transferase
VRTPSPALGEHTEEVLRDFLGFAPAAIAELRAARAIGPTQDANPKPAGVIK